MNESLLEISKLIRSIWQRKWVVLAVTFVVCLFGWVYVLAVMPNKYESMARVFINDQTTLTPLLRGIAVESGRADRFGEMARRTLLSRPNLEKVVRETDMDLAVNSPLEKESLLRTLAEKITVEGSGKNNIYLISYRNKDPFLAKKVVESLLEIFVESTVGVVRSDSSVAERFLDEQIREYETKLEAAEERLKVFKQSNIGLMPTESGGYFTKLQNELDVLEKARLELGEAEQRRAELRKQLQNEKEASSQINNQTQETPSSYDERISSMESRLDSLLLQYTDQHPDVISVKASIAQLKSKKDEELQEQKNTAGTSDGVKNSQVYQEIKVALGKTEANVSALSVRVREYESRVSQLRELIDTIPKVEAELARLNRDYNINKSNYEGLVSRRESAKISREAGQSVDDIQFKIIDPPVSSVEPVSPNRPLLLTAVLCLGLGLGVGLAWVLGQMKPSFSDSKDLRDSSGLPVIGSISLVTVRKVNTKQFLLFGLSSVLLLFVYLVLMAAQFLNIDFIPN